MLDEILLQLNMVNITNRMSCLWKKGKAVVGGSVEVHGSAWTRMHLSFLSFLFRLFRLLPNVQHALSKPLNCLCTIQPTSYAELHHDIYLIFDPIML